MHLAYSAGNAFLLFTRWFKVGLVQVYTCAAALMRAGGWGPVRDLAAPVMQCMLLELYSVAPAAPAHAPKGAAGSKQAKKRKRAKAEDDLAGISSGSALLASAHVRTTKLLSQTLHLKVEDFWS